MGTRGYMKSGEKAVFNSYGLLLLFLMSCQQQPNRIDLQKEQGALLAIHEAGKKAHVETNVELLMADTGDSFFNVSRGKIYTNSRVEVEQFFQEYFKDATYHKYEDLQPPIVRISGDGSLGWIISRVQAKRSQVVDGESADQEFVHAGIMLYEKRAGKWIRIGSVSTFEG